jgi:hypothetical protein
VIRKTRKMKKYIPAIAITVLVGLTLHIVYKAGKADAWAYYGDGYRNGLNSVDGVVEEYKAALKEAKNLPDPNVDWHQLALSWRTAAEHYGGICKWLLENEPIYGTIVMGPNTVLSECLIVAGSADTVVDVSGMNALIKNNWFTSMDMDWLLEQTPVDPNEYCDVADLNVAAEAIDIGADVYRIKLEAGHTFEITDCCFTDN